MQDGGSVEIGFIEFHNLGLGLGFRVKVSGDTDLGWEGRTIQFFIQLVTKGSEVISFIFIKYLKWKIDSIFIENILG